MDDWQDEVFNHRRIPHGRSKKSGKAAGRKGAGTFDPKQALGSYELSGTVVATLLAEAEETNAVFEIHELTETPGGMIGSLVVGKKLKAAVLLAGSRKLLSTIVGEAESIDSDEEDSDVEEDDVEAEGEEDEDEGEPETELQAQDRKANERAQAFEKNSFRNPKFWLQWQGDVAGSDAEPVRERNQGYVVFSGNDCKDLKGTLSCKTLNWEDAAVQGRKTTSRPRPAFLGWNDCGIADAN
ncbi:hypothetical protein LTR08_004802 [Meristemomyces frigidus]|nr:hypothetical protein LTR08_004802 [Meristemomyces frigidus]